MKGSLRQQIALLPQDLRARLDAAGFDPDRLATLAARANEPDRDGRNRVKGEVKGPAPAEVPDAPRPGTPEHSRLSAVGEGAVRRGELAFCVMAGGMATRMGGVVKALVKAAFDKTFLELRLNENATWGARAGRPVPLWLMTSEATHEGITKALAEAKAPGHVATFMQNIGLRLTVEGDLFFEDDGEPSTYATGHGDLVDAIRRSGLLTTFLAAGGKYVWITNLDNLGGTLDPALLGHFIETGRDVMVEVCEKAAGDRGGIPVWAGGRLQVLEEFRLPKGFDAASVRVFNTNTFLVSAPALATVPIEWNWFEVEKKVGTRTAVQFERLLQELTAAMPAAYAKVPREGAESRFLPVKDFDELARRRADIEAVARARGMV